MLLPIQPLLGQLSKPVEQLGPVLAPAPLVDQDEEGGVGRHPSDSGSQSWRQKSHLLQPNLPAPPCYRPQLTAAAQRRRRWCVAAARPDPATLKCLKPRSLKLCLAPRPKSHWRPGGRKFGPARAGAGEGAGGEGHTPPPAP